MSETEQGGADTPTAAPTMVERLEALEQGTVASPESVEAGNAQAQAIDELREAIDGLGELVKAQGQMLATLADKVAELEARPLPAVEVTEGDTE